MKLYYDGQEIGSINTNMSLTVSEALYAIGYDVDEPEDLQKAFEDMFPAAYIDDMGNYCIDEDNIIMVYDEFTADSFGSDCPENWQEIVAYLNSRLATGEDPGDIWEKYCNGGYLDAPEPKMNN